MVSWSFMNRALWFNVCEDELDWNEHTGTHTIGIEAYQRNIILERRKLLKVRKKRISDFYNWANRPENLEFWAEKKYTDKRKALKFSNNVKGKIHQEVEG
jgi:hypothetical protein